MPRVSVLLPCRDAADTLSEALASLLAQSYADLEVLAVDDHSTDATSALLASCARRDPRLRIIPARGTGIVAALNQALEHARGEFVARMDADDICELNRLALQVSAFDADPDLVACGCQVRYFPREAVRDGARRYEQWLNALVTDADIRRDRFIECPIAHPALVARRATLQQVGGYREMGWPEDYDLVLRLAEAGRLHNVPEVLLHWREGPARLSRTHAVYHEDAFRRCKLHHLDARIRARQGVVVWGAGPVGKGFARLLAGADVAIRAFVELDPRKLGQTIHGAPVVPPDAINRFRNALALAAVSGPVARAEIRASLGQAGWVEGEDYFAVA